jgi:hypothetical protein
MARVFRAIWLICAGLLVGTAASADGLDRFQREVLPRLAPGTLSFGKATASGPLGVVLENVVFNSNGRDGARPGETYRIARVSIEAFDFEGITAGGAARFATLQLSGVQIPESASFAGFLRKFGVLPPAADISLDYRYDPATQVLSVTRLDITAPGLARLSGDVIFEGIKPPFLEGNRLFNEASVRSARLTYEDQSALGRAIAASASRQGKSHETVEREWRGNLGNWSRNKGEQTTAALDAVVSVVEDHRRPKGPVRITLAPARPMPLRQVALQALGSDFARSVGLSVAYTGTRSNAASAAILR